ncbi:hypothetical protein BGZ73_006424 [Actinomortierella ambigua]|nr:hypothetical protein BGZ73_006424 [Actinomortierella ambigua]
MGRVRAPMATTACPWLTCFSWALTRTGSFQHLWRASLPAPTVCSGRSISLLNNCNNNPTRRWRSTGGRVNTTCLTGQTPAAALHHSPIPLVPWCPSWIAPARFHSSSHWKRTLAKDSASKSKAKDIIESVNRSESASTPSSAKMHSRRIWGSRTRRRRSASYPPVQASAISHHRLARKFRLFRNHKSQASRSKRGDSSSSSSSSKSPGSAGAWDPRRGQLMNRESRLLWQQLDGSLQRRDVRQAYDQYLFLRQQTRGQLHVGGTPFLQSRRWMDLQLNFLRLLYMHEYQTILRVTTSSSSSSSALSSSPLAATGSLRFWRWTNTSPSALALPHQLPKRIQPVILEIQRRQNRLYEDMLLNTFRDYPGTAALARSLAQSLSILGRTGRNGEPVQKEWREALRPLEEWSRLYRPTATAATTITTTTTGMQPAEGQEATGSVLGEGSMDQTGAATTAAATAPSTTATTVIHPHMAKRLEQHLELLMRKLVYTHTALMRQLFDELEERFGLESGPTFGMHMTFLRHYARFGYGGKGPGGGSTAALQIVKLMQDRQLPWQEEAEVYDLLLASMARRAGWRNEIRLLVDTMLAHGVLPKQETMQAAMLCAARSGDVATCSSYLDRMHREWGLTPSERLKSILLYACAKRGDFQGAVEVFGQLMDRGHLTRTNTPVSSLGSRDTGTALAVEESQKGPQGDLDNALVNQSNLLLALINQSTASAKGRRRDPGQDRTMIQKEARLILQLFTMIAHPRQGDRGATTSKVDSHLYTILMQYLSTLPAPLQGMRHLYEEMLKRAETSPNLITYKILLDACAEQMDMTTGQGYWNDMVQQGILPNKHVSASYIKGWCRVGEFAKAEAVCREALQMSLGTDKVAVEQAKRVLRRRAALEQLRSQADSEGGRGGEGERVNPPVPRSLSRKRIRDIRHRLVNDRMIMRQLARQQAEAFDVSVVEALMQGQGGFVQRAIDTFSRIESGVRRTRPKGHLAASSIDSRVAAAEEEEEQVDTQEEEEEQQKMSSPSSETVLPEMEWADLLTDGAFFHYFGVLGRSHRADLLVPTWKSLLRAGVHPSSRTVSRLLDCLEDYQWGLSAIKRIQQDLEHNWPEQDWSNVIGDRSGGRLWK